MEVELSFQDSDKDAAWELYVELLTRIVTQPLPQEAGDEQTALNSIHGTISYYPFHLAPAWQECYKIQHGGDTNIKSGSTAFYNKVA